MISAAIISGDSKWETVGRQLFEIEQRVFGKKAFSEEMMRTDLDDLESILAILKDDDLVVGFAYALPEEEKTACVVDIAITQEYQGKRLVALLMSCLEAEFKKQGYEYVVEHAMVENGYADKIVRNYGSRILESRDFVGEYGKQRYFKISL